jgi:hypothetical protein
MVQFRGMKSIFRLVLALVSYSFFVVLIWGTLYSFLPVGKTFQPVVSSGFLRGLSIFSCRLFPWYVENKWQLRAVARCRLSWYAG